MQERLLQLGDWLRTHGEAVYGTRPWKVPFQWSEGSRDYRPAKQSYLGGDFILKLTVNPEPGYAVKQAFFTRKDDTLYAILPRRPEGNVYLDDVAPSRSTRASLLGGPQQLKWRRAGSGLDIRIPPLTVNDLPPQPAYVLRLSEGNEEGRVDAKSFNAHHLAEKSDKSGDYRQKKDQFYGYIRHTLIHEEFHDRMRVTADFVDIVH